MYGIDLAVRKGYSLKEMGGVCGPPRKTIPCAIHDQSLCFLSQISKGFFFSLARWLLTR